MEEMVEKGGEGRELEDGETAVEVELGVVVVVLCGGGGGGGDGGGGGAEVGGR